MFVDAVPICRELNTRAGPIDNLLVTPTGLPVLIECKLWRNPEARREVIGQIIDYAKELSRWSASDLQREVARRVGGDGNPVLDAVRRNGREVDEIAFNDALTLNLRRGRFLLLIVGDGIREGVEAISEYLQAHAGLHFTLGLIELPIYLMPDGKRLLVPRVLARTHLASRTVVALPDGYAIKEEEEDAADDFDQEALNRTRFWQDFLAILQLSDPEQTMPRPSRQGYVTLSLPVPGSTAWFTVFRNEARCEVGIYLSYTRESIGERAVLTVVEDWPSIAEELGGTVKLVEDKLGRKLIEDRLITESWREPKHKAAALAWLARRTNDFVNVLRPRVKDALAVVAGEKI